MEKRLFVQLNANRKVIGILRGYDVGFEPPIPDSRFLRSSRPLLLRKNALAK
jgi:hypothetical protein